MPRRASATSYGNKSGNPRGNGPAKGTGGAPTQSFKHFLANLRNSAKAQKALQAAAEDETSSNFKTAWKLLSDYDEERPAARVSVDVSRIRDMSDAELEAIAAGKVKR